jgi:hypothetical protein
MNQLYLFPSLETRPRFLLNEGGVDLYDVPRLDFTTKDPNKPNKARTIKTEKMHLLDDIEKGKYIIYPTGEEHAGDQYKDRGKVFPFVLNTKTQNNTPVRLSRCKYPSLTVRTTLGKSIDFLVHELFAIAFLENKNPERFSVVDHINDDHLDYRLINLNWESYSNNQRKAAAKKKKEKERGDGVLRRKL